MRIKPLTEEQYDFVRQYIQLLITVEDGIELVDISYQERNFGSGDKLLKDIVGAFVPLNSSNTTIGSILTYDSGLSRQLEKFPAILEQVLHLNEIINDSEEKKAFIHDFLLPAYKQWKNKVDNILQEYVAN